MGGLTLWWEVRYCEEDVGSSCGLGDVDAYLEKN